jgi:hypothetical protein
MLVSGPTNAIHGNGLGAYQRPPVAASGWDLLPPLAPGFFRSPTPGPRPRESCTSRRGRPPYCDGAHEHGAGHYPMMVMLHATWLATLWFFGWNHAASLPFVAAFVLLQGARLCVPCGGPALARGTLRGAEHRDAVVARPHRGPCLCAVAVCSSSRKKRSRRSPGRGLASRRCVWGFSWRFWTFRSLPPRLPRIATAPHTPLDELSCVQTAYLITEMPRPRRNRAQSSSSVAALPHHPFELLDRYLLLCRVHVLERDTGTALALDPLIISIADPVRDSTLRCCCCGTHRSRRRRCGWD